MALLSSRSRSSTIQLLSAHISSYFVREHEELHLRANLAVVALLGFLEHDEVFVENLLLGERDAV
ncbi:MAG: hypothetical protein J6P89_09730, partial [Oscillospiraceae bacterium]|nr:hypothetical protein [Oscillospiraceae bacterium]